jgi:Na+/melibiose symporter-like transporter
MKIISTQYRVFQLKYLTLSHQKMPHLQVIQLKANDKFCKAIALMLLCIYSCFHVKLAIQPYFLTSRSNHLECE